MQCNSAREVQLKVFDLNSSNGTFVNGRNIKFAKT
ncbi:MAG: FHA domain-containing protein [Lachnospiraceae bacterium]|nr:FHA domain-containing protein [Lachnospiraceae bacterium]